MWVNNILHAVSLKGKSKEIFFIIQNSLNELINWEQLSNQTPANLENSYAHQTMTNYQTNKQVDALHFNKYQLMTLSTRHHVHY
jgi:hypothetical protein